MDDNRPLLFGALTAGVFVIFGVLHALSQPAPLSREARDRQAMRLDGGRRRR